VGRTRPAPGVAEPATGPTSPRRRANEAVDWLSAYSSTSPGLRQRRGWPPWPSRSRVTGTAGRRRGSRTWLSWGPTRRREGRGSRHRVDPAPGGPDVDADPRRGVSRRPATSTDRLRPRFAPTASVPSTAPPGTVHGTVTAPPAATWFDPQLKRLAFVVILGAIMSISTRRRHVASTRWPGLQGPLSTSSGCRPVTCWPCPWSSPLSAGPWSASGPSGCGSSPGHLPHGSALAGRMVGQARCLPGAAGHRWRHDHAGSQTILAERPARGWAG